MNRKRYLLPSGAYVDHAGHIMVIGLEKSAHRVFALGLNFSHHIFFVDWILNV